jgi:hypothetical protein
LTPALSRFAALWAISATHPLNSNLRSLEPDAVSIEEKVSSSRFPFRFGLRSFLVWITLLCILCAGASWLWFKPDPHELRLLEIRRQLSQLPSDFGAWRAVGASAVNLDFDLRALYFSQTYDHASTGEDIRLVLVAGHLKEALRYTYIDGCDVELEAGPIELELDGPGTPAVFWAWATKANPHRGIGFWAMTREGNWIAPAHAREEFAHDRLVYRLILIAERPGDIDVRQAIAEVEAPIRDLAEHALPELNRLLFRAE